MDPRAKFVIKWYGFLATLIALGVFFYFHPEIPSGLFDALPDAVQIWIIIFGPICLFVILRRYSISIDDDKDNPQIDRALKQMNHVIAGNTSSSANNEDWDDEEDEEEDMPLGERDLHAFDRLVGVDDAKKEIQTFFDVMMAVYNDPESIKRYEIKPPRGVLLYGPPGTGKTAFARAAAKYYGLEFGNIKGSELVAGCSAVGQAEEKVKQIFEYARMHAPFVLFFDEIDAIAQTRRGQSINSPSDLILNNLLTELDGFNERDAVFIIAATNRRDILDPAILRPGRLDKHIEIPLPNQEARKRIFKAHLGEKPVAGSINLEFLSQQTEGKSGAFIETCINRASLMAWKRQDQITQADLESAIHEFGGRSI
jgi:ATP-dependent 26S proteasome regulatory subunit